MDEKRTHCVSVSNCTTAEENFINLSSTRTSIRMVRSGPMDPGALQSPVPRPVHGLRVSLQALLLVALLMPQIVLSMCPNRCNGRGDCNPFGRCECWSGWGGGDCSQRACATGVAWSDEATATDTAHDMVECSNRGECDRATGRCKCMSGFSGAACERSNCPRGCSGHGHCISMATYSEDYRGAESVQYTYNDVWDGHKLFGCLCDTGFHGFDCSLHECPRGDDPLTTGQVNEVQLLVCEARTGSFVLYYEGYATPTIPHDASEVNVEDALSSIPVIQQGVDVEFSLDYSGACNSTAMNVIQVEFLGNFGPLRPMWSYNSLTPGDVTSLTITADGSTIYDSDGVGYESIKGSKENVECSNRGICGTQEGICECFTSNDDIFASSDGYNGPGTRGDCGFQVTKTAGCPGEIACSGHGTCYEDTFTCDCNHGWTAGDCSQRTCPYGLSWFSYPSAEDKAHDERTECSDGGLCNRETGMCECGDLFHGSACEYSVCPGGITSACHGRGRCMSMAELALVAENNGDATDFTYGGDANKGSTWDAHRMFGCRCDYGYAGYDCSERVCPTGDDPGSWGQESEVQTITCQATDGTFTLRFRQEETVPISSDATSAELRKALEDLDTLDVVLISFALGPETTVCQNDGSGVASVTFITQHGDVPLMSTDASLLIDDANGGAPGSGNVAVSERIKGTTEEETCSNRGLCDAGTGKCSCFSGWASSDGAGGIGDRGDCGYRVPMTTHLRGGSQAGEGNVPTTWSGYTARGRQREQEANQNSFRGISHVDDSLARRKDMLLAAHQY